MARHWWKLLVAVAALPVIIWGWDCVQTVDWVGLTDLEIEFVLTEAGSRTPIPGARVEVWSEGGFHAEDYPQEFVLAADSAGIARTECRHSMCCGTRSGLGLTDTLAVHLPWWRFRASAPSFEPSAWVPLDVVESQRRVHRTGPGKAKLVVPVALPRRPP